MVLLTHVLKNLKIKRRPLPHSYIPSCGNLKNASNLKVIPYQWSFENILFCTTTATNWFNQWGYVKLTENKINLTSRSRTKQTAGRPSSAGPHFIEAI